MNWEWAQDHEKALSDKAIRYFGSWDKALKRIDLDPKKIRLFRPTWRGFSPWRNANKSAIIAELRRRKRSGEPLFWREIADVPAGPALLNRAVKLFGSWTGALAATGLDPFGGRRHPWRTASKAEILKEIRRRKRAGESLRHSEVVAEKGGQPLVKRAKKFFGSWNEALRAVGIEPEAGRSKWADADKKAILAKLRRLKVTGKTRSIPTVTKQKWGRALYDRTTELFGTWNKALRAAGVKPLRENSPWPKASKADIISEIRRRKRVGASLQTTKIEREKWGGAFMKRTKKLFGSYSAAILEAGVRPFAGLTSPWPRADKDTILREIRRRKRSGKPLNYGVVASQQWGAALQKRAQTLFGSWTAALSRADVDLPARSFSPWRQAKKADILAEIRRRKQARKSSR